MKHLEEGTIHAWLDGALSEDEAREVSEHSATCAQCGAMVGEARGFIAGTSRILTSLDDVPSVAPKRAPVVANAKPAQRFWQAAPWVTGIAAALMLAIGVKEWRDRPSAKAAFAPVAATMDSLRALDAPVARTVDSALRPNEPRVLQSVSAPPPVTQSKTLARSRAPTELAKKDVAADALQPSAKLIPAAPVPTAAGFAESVSRERRDERLLAGCYALEVVRELSALGAVAKAAASRAPEANQRRIAPTAAASAPAAAAAFALPAIVRLDTTSTSLGRVVVSAANGETLGTWRASDGDSVRLMMPVAGVRMIATSTRVACPPAPEGRP